MIKLGEAQFALLVLSLLVTIYLVLLNVNRIRLNEVFSRARWLMAVGTALLTAQFAIQYGGGFRASSLTMGVLVNLLLFMAADNRTGTLLSLADTPADRTCQKAHQGTP